MRVSRLKIKNYRGIKNATLEFSGHTLMVGANNIGKSTICEALDLVLAPERNKRFPVVEEFDFYNGHYLDDEENPIKIEIEALLTDLTPAVEKLCADYLERWDSASKRILGSGEIEKVDKESNCWCLRVMTIARYNKEEDEFEAATYFAKSYDPANDTEHIVRHSIKRKFGFIYLRALRTGSRALSLERGSLLDIILRVQSLQTGIWEHMRRRLENLDPSIEDGATKLTPVLQTIEARLAEYMAIANPGKATRLHVSRLTREHLRKTLSFFVSISGDQKPVPFTEVGTGTLNTLVLALLSFMADLKDENVIFAMEEPEIAIAPHTQRRIASYLTTKTTQCFVTSHSPYVIESFDPQCILVLRRNSDAKVYGYPISLKSRVKEKTYKKYVRRGFAEAILGSGVIVVEGITEQLVLQSVAQMMERADSGKYSLDLSGITIITSDGEGNIPEFGHFFSDLELPCYAFFDQKRRSDKEKEAFAKACFKFSYEIPYIGMENLLVEEIPLNIQWDYLDEMREKLALSKILIPQNRPDNSVLKQHMRHVLKDGKGEGRAADLLEHCSISELPKTIVGFLEKIYSDFPCPKPIDILSAKESNSDKEMQAGR
jgi:putative ATP-dependent endonuclease of OLD family